LRKKRVHQRVVLDDGMGSDKLEEGIKHGHVLVYDGLIEATEHQPIGVDKL